MKQRLFRFNCETTDTLTSLYSRVDEVKRDLDSLAISAQAPKVMTTSQVCESNGPHAGRTYSVHNSEEEGKNQSSRQANFDIPNSSSATSLSMTNSFRSSYALRKFSNHEDDMDTDDLRSISRSSGSELNRSTSATPFATVNELLGETSNDYLASSEQQHAKRKQADSTMFIIQHLMQKRDELKIIDKQLYEMITRYLVQLDSTYRKNKWSNEGKASEMPIEAQLPKRNEQRAQMDLAWQQHYQPQNAAANSKPISIENYHEHDHNNLTTDANKPIDLSLEGARFRTISSPPQTILARLQDSKFIHDSTDASVMGSVAVIKLSAASDDSVADGRQHISNIDQRSIKIVANSNIHNFSGQITRKQSTTINLRKSRLLGASNFSNVDSQSNPKLLPITSTQLKGSTYNDHGDKQSSPLTNQLQRSPMNLLTRYTTPQPPPHPQPQSATMEVSPSTSTSSPTASSALRLKQNDDQISSYQQQQQAMILAPVDQLAIAISPYATEFNYPNHHHHQQQMDTNEVSGPETRRSPLHKKFRSISQMIDTDDKHAVNHFGRVLLSGHQNQLDGHTKLLSFDEELIYRQQAHQHFAPSSSHQLDTITPVARDDNSLALLNHKIHLNDYHKANHVGSTASECYNNLVPIVCADQTTSTYILATDQPTLNQSSFEINQNHLIQEGNHLTNSGYLHALTISPAGLTATGSIDLLQTNSCKERSQQVTPAMARQEHQRDLQRVDYRCHVCSSGFEDRHRLQQHLSIHLTLHSSWFEEKTIKETMARYEMKRGDYLCASCNKRFETTSEFDRHMHLHREKPHTCELCDQESKTVSFRYYRQLLTHLRSHCFIYSCRFTPDCKQTANRKDYLKLHILKHHLNNKLPEQYTVYCH